MPVFTVPIHEHNDCHNPAGPSGGQFCSDNVGSTRTVAGDKERFKQLKDRWSEINNDLLNYIDIPDDPEVTSRLQQMKGIIKEIYTLQADPGGIEGIGLPGGPRDMVIIGAGPGGLAAAVMGGADGLDTLFIDASTEVGGQAKHSSRVENYPGFPIGATGKFLAGQLHEQAQRVGAEGKLGVRVTGLTHDPKSGLKTVTLSTGEKIESRSVIIAGGVEFRKMKFPGSDSKSVVYGDGERLLKEGAGKPVVVVGGSNGAAQAALGAARSASEVYLISRSPVAKGMSDYQVSALANHKKIRVIEGDEIAELRLAMDGSAETLVTKNGREIKTSMLGVFVGSAPETGWLPKDLGMKDGKIAVNNDLETNYPGVFAIGDIRHGSIGRIGAAVGDGQMAERGVFQYFERSKSKVKG